MVIVVVIPAWRLTAGLVFSILKSRQWNRVKKTGREDNKSG